MANHCLLRMFDLTPGSIIADNRDNRQFVSYHALEFHTIQAKSTITVQDEHFFTGTDKLGCHCKACASTETAHWAGIEPVTGFADIYHFAPIAHNVTPIADHCRILVNEVAYLTTQAHRVDRCSIRSQSGGITF